MTNKNNITSFTSLLKRSKALLIVLSVILILANFYVLSETRKLTRAFSEQQNQATWSLFQLTKEFSSLVVLTPLSLTDQQFLKKTELAYELTWSRFDLLLHAEEANHFMKIEGTRLFFSKLFVRFTQLEPLVFQLNDQDQVNRLNREVNAIYKDLLGYVNINFRINNPFYLKRTEQAKLLDQTQIALMLLLFACAALVGYVLHLESKANKQLAMTDALTHIPNRLAMAQHTQQLIVERTDFTLCLLDLNGFKQINDRYGHQAGDHALQQLASRFTNDSNRLLFTAYRIGGDEFALILRQHSSEQLEHALNCALDCFTDKIEVERGILHALSASVGLASYPSQADTYSELIKIADRNMYQMKFATRTHTRQT
ncbi:GGDEF domain-containing protein [Vibrio panuliri]|uniref:diguanylate cyclase n=1 Tax=Vibrio panuliri TaxID=1381081 RepID=A0ABX3FNN3_9VIBR|nr:GGDEF domain-containing protein [Vibrio panuliri]KAB1457623.1 GGDEF domain-containing protein [Vibrio panuliri]OLQ95831.1 diguanylate cyclase [Vibrio panuliri]